MPALYLAQALGLRPERVIIVGCEPASCQPGLDLTSTVHAAVERAVEGMRRLVLSDAERSENCATDCTVRGLDRRGEL